MINSVLHSSPSHKRLQRKMNELSFIFLRVTWSIYGVNTFFMFFCRRSRVQRFPAYSGVQGSILVPGLHLGCVFTRKASASSGLIQNLEPNWQLFGKMSIFNEDFGSLMPSLPSYVTRQGQRHFSDQTGNFGG